MPSIVQIFDRPCCGPSAAADLAGFLRERLGSESSVDYHDLNSATAGSVTVPAAVLAHLSGGGALPAMAVDGRLVAAGTMPNLMDALDFATGRRRETAALPVTPTASSDSCC